MAIIISPSLLSCDFLNIEAELKPFATIPDLWLHLDIMDGHFVPNLTFGHPIVQLISKATKCKLDAHFMVTNPEFYIETFKDMHIHNFTFHVECQENTLELVRKAKKYYPSVGVSIKPNTPVEALSDEILQEISLVLVMSVEPGFGGQAFIEGTYSKIKKLKIRMDKLNKQFMIQVDGGINSDNAKFLIEAGADNLVAGSYIFKVPPEQYQYQVGGLRT